MLDIFGNLLGKSKKSSSQQQANGSGGGGGGQTDDSTANENDSYVFVNHNNSAPYPQTTILTDEMIRTMGSSSSVAHQSSQSVNSQSGPNSLVYPSLDVTNGYNPNLPFSTAMPSANRNSLSAPQFGHNSKLSRTASPIDNVPFVLSNYTSAGNNGAGAGGYDDDAEVGEIISRIQTFLANPNQSEYNFKLENGLLQATFNLTE